MRRRSHFSIIEYERIGKSFDRMENLIRFLPALVSVWIPIVPAIAFLELESVTSLRHRVQAFDS